MYVIRRKSDGKYAKGYGYGWNKSWVEDLQKARVFTQRGHAKNSLHFSELKEDVEFPEVSLALVAESAVIETDPTE